MSPLKKYAIVLAVPVLAIVGYYWMANPAVDKKPVTSITNEKLTPTAISESQIPSNATKFVALPKSAAETPSQKLARFYVITKDKRQFFDEARLQPEAGGAYLAELVRSECMLNVSKNSTNAATIQKKIALISMDAPNRDERIAAIRKIHEPCLGFDTSPISYGDLASLIPESTKAFDPVFKAKRELRASYEANGDLSKVPDIVGDAVKSGNSYALQNALQQVAAATLNYPAYSNFIDGVELMPQDARAFMAAAGLVACQFGMDCSASSKAMLEFCTEGKCNLDAYQLTQQIGLPPEEYARMVLFHNQIVNGLQNGNYKIITVQKRVFK